MNIKQIIALCLTAISIAFKIQAQDGLKLTSGIKKALIDSLSQALNRNYVYPDKAAEMSSALYQKQQKNGYSSFSDPRQLAVQITRDLRAVLNDIHLSVRFDPDLEKRIRAFVVTGQKETSDLEKERNQNFFFQKAEILKGNIGYVAFTNFADLNDLSLKTVQAAFRFVAHTDALILDLRNNFGGRGKMAKEITGYFFDKPQLTGRSFSRIENKWTEDWVGDTSMNNPEVFLSMPIYILTSERTFSAAEGLAYNLKYLKNAMVVGDTTRGGAHSTRSFALGNGFVGFIPYSRGEHIITKTDWEWTGVLPDVPVSEEAALRKAQELILAKKSAAVTDTMEMRKLHWLLNDLQATSVKVDLPQETLMHYTGAFEEFLFTLEDGALYCRNTNGQDKKNRLVPIHERLFKIDEHSMVEFISDGNGKVTGIKLLWDDGWVDLIEKSK